MTRSPRSTFPGNRPSLARLVTLLGVGLLPAVASAQAPAQPSPPPATAAAADGTTPVPASDAAGASVVRIAATIQGPNPIRPWQKGNRQESTGTGVVIDGRRILTNAHLVSYATAVSVEPNGGSAKFAARVEYVAPGVDLAVLRVADEGFFAQHPAVTPAQALPSIPRSAAVYGYPTAGSGLAMTRGTIHRIDLIPPGAGLTGLRIQFDAAVNPGTSGGPALAGGVMIGLVNSAVRLTDNSTALIATEEINLFLRDIGDGRYDGKPVIRDQFQSLENDALRAMLGFGQRSDGVVVHEPGSRAEGYPLRKWDVVTRIGDHAIDNVFRTQVRDDLRLHFEYYLPALTREGKVPITLVRDGVEMAAELPLAPQPEELIPPLQGRHPSYFVYGPLVFSTATTEYLMTLTAGDRLILAAIGSPLMTRLGARVAFPGEELVMVAAPMFTHKLGVGYSSPLAKVVRAINGAPIRNLRHLVETLRDSRDRYIRIDFDDKNSETIVFDREEVLRATPDILQDNKVPQQASADLLPVWLKMN